jgi:choice-of-anchor B domain-containing protein
MKLKLLSIFFLVGIISFAQTPCVNGFAGPYPCEGYDLQAHIGLNVLDATKGNDSWGWTDPDDGKEYAIMCLSNGTAFIDISDPVNPVYLGKLPTHTGNSSWRDAKVYNNFAFIVSDVNSGQHGMQVFDLTRLRNVVNPPMTFTNDAHYDGFGNCHNIVINEENGFAYAVGTTTFNGGPHIVNIQNPLQPTFAAGYGADGYTHDAQVVTYTGPDPDHTGKEIYIGSNENEVVLLDVTNKANIQKISSISYSNVGYTHQGWFTEDQRFFIVGDETDEIFFGFNTRTLVFDLLDLDNPQLHMEYEGPTPATDHNGYVLGDKYFLANYTAGLRVLDISDIENKNITEIAYFDTFPDNDNVGTEKLWSVYPYFASGNIVLSDIDGGFFLVKDPNFLAVEDIQIEQFTIFPNPADNFLTIKSQNAAIVSISIYNTIGQEVLTFNNPNTFARAIDISSLTKGMYFVNINGNTSKKIIKK